MSCHIPEPKLTIDFPSLYLCVMDMRIAIEMSSNRSYHVNRNKYPQNR